MERGGERAVLRSLHLFCGEGLNELGNAHRVDICEDRVTLATLIYLLLRVVRLVRWLIVSERDGSENS